MNPKVDAYLKKAKKWREESGKLRTIILGFPLVEELKWDKPCYAFNGSNLLLVIGFKDYCTLMFCKGSLLRDARKILVAAGPNTQTARQIRFTNVGQIAAMEAIIKAYIRESIEAEKAGLKVKYKSVAEFAMPDEFRKALDAAPALKKAFAALTPGRQKAYLLHFAAAKQSKTRESRIAKCAPRILDGKGMDDR